jgi:hypothetical protein
VPHARPRLSQRLTPSAEEDARCAALLSWLASLLSARFTGVSLALYGSAVSRLHSRGSDVDVSLLVAPATKFAPHDGADEEARVTLRRRLLGALSRELGRAASVRNLSFIAHARVPLVKFTDVRSGVACDVCVANDGVFKSGVLGLLAEMQPRFQSLVRLVKAWAKGNNINDPSSGTLNSFALALMCLFHCQTGVTPPLLPPLAALLCDDVAGALAQENARAASGAPLPGPLRVTADACRDMAPPAARAAALAAAGFGNDNTATVPALAASFFAHWAAALPALAAGATPRPFAGVWGAGGAWGARKAYALAIEDPFEAHENPARSLYKGDQYDRVAAAVRSAAAALAAPPPPGGLRALASALFGDADAFEEGGSGELKVPPKPPPAASAPRAGGRARARARGKADGAGGRGERGPRGGGRAAAVPLAVAVAPAAAAPATAAVPPQPARVLAPPPPRTAAPKPRPAPQAAALQPPMVPPPAPPPPPGLQQLPAAAAPAANGNNARGGRPKPLPMPRPAQPPAVPAPAPPPAAAAAAPAPAARNKARNRGGAAPAGAAAEGGAAPPAPAAGAAGGQAAAPNPRKPRNNHPPAPDGGAGGGGGRGGGRGRDGGSRRTFVFRNKNAGGTPQAAAA